MNNISGSCVLNLSSVTLVPRELAKPAYILKPGDVLFCHTNSTKLVGKTALFDQTDGPYAFSNHLTRLRPSVGGSLPEWLWFWLASLWRQRYFETRCKRWVNQATVERHTLLSAPIPIAPLVEQKKIIALILKIRKLDEVAKVRFQKVPWLIKQFRQSVLARAFRGGLTERDPSDEPADMVLARVRQERFRSTKDHHRARRSFRRTQEGEPIDLGNLEKLPENWAWTTLGTVVDVVQFGTSVKASATSANGIPILRMGNIKEGKLDFSDVKYMDPRDEQFEKYELKMGDILINRTNSPELVGKCAQFQAEGKYMFASYLIRLRSLRGAASDAYLSFIINSPVGRRHIDAVKHQVAGQSNINTRDIESMPIPLAPLQEQLRIAEKISEIFSRADRIQEAMVIGSKNAEALEPSILRKAFRGELVPHHPNDEPASVLLKRIRTQGLAASRRRTSQTPLDKTSPQDIIHHA